MDPTIITAFIGAVTTIIATLLGRQNTQNKQKENEQIRDEWKKFKNVVEKVDSYLNVDYGIELISPKSGDKVSEWIEVTGVYKTMPPPDTLRLFTVSDKKTSSGERYWPQEIVKEFSSKTNTWKARVNIGDPDPTRNWSIIVAVVGQPTIILWNYYYKVGPKIGWWDFEGWPSDSRICHRMDGIKRL